MISVKKFVGVILLIFGIVFICTIFGSYYLDLSAVKLPDIPQIKSIFEAQLAMVRIICCLAGGCLGLIALIIAVFNINRHINENQSSMGILKALGYSNLKISSEFSKIGLYVLNGAIAGYIGGMMVAPIIYEEMANTESFSLDLSFHALLPISLIGGITTLFSVLSFLFAYIKLKKPALSMIKKETLHHLSVIKLNKRYKTDNSFLTEFRRNTCANHKILMFFIGFASFGFSAQIQLPITMISSSMGDTSMSVIITAICFPIGILLGGVTLFIVGECIIQSNSEAIAIMKAFGYTDKECNNALLNVYRLPAFIGFLIGTAYQYTLIQLFVSLFADTYTIEIPFNILGFVIVFFIFLIGYEMIMYGYKRKLSQTNLKRIMESNL